MRIRSQGADRLELTEFPWVFWIFGILPMAITVGSLIAAVRNFDPGKSTDLVLLDFSRATGLCRITTGNAAIQHTQEFPLAELQGATIHSERTDDGDDTTSYVLLNRRGHAPQAVSKFTPEAGDVAERLNKFVKDKSVPEFHYRYDQGWAGVIGMIVVHLMVFALGLAMWAVPYTRWEFDAAANQITCRRRWLLMFGKTTRWPLDSVTGVQVVERESSEGDTLYGIELTTGRKDRIGVSAVSSSGSETKEKVADVIRGMLERRAELPGASAAKRDRLRGEP